MAVVVCMLRFSYTVLLNLSVNRRSGLGQLKVSPHLRGNHFIHFYICSYIEPHKKCCDNILRRSLYDRVIVVKGIQYKTEY